MQSFEWLISYTTEQIRFKAESIDIILKTAFCHKETECIRDFWNSHLELQPTNGLCESDFTTVSSWYDGLGKSDIAGQIKHGEHFKAEVHTIAQEAKEAFKNKGKLYISLGMAGGLTLALLWI